MKPAGNRSGRWLPRLVLVAALLAGAGFGLLYWLRPVASVAVATLGTAVRAVPGSVEVDAEYAQELKSAVGGRVAESTLDLGQRVRAGDILVRLDTGDVDLEIERIKNEIVAAKKKVELGSPLRADIENMRDTVTENERRARAGAYPEAELQKERRTLQQLEQRMELDEVNANLALENFQNSLAVKQREKTKMVIAAPLDGVVTAVLARPGDLIGSNSPIATIMTTTRTVKGRFSEENFAVVKVGQNASVRFLTYGKDQYNAKVSKLLPSADSATQRYTVYLDVLLPEGRALVPGLTGEVSIIVAQRANAVIIPRRALVGEYVYVVERGRIALRKVEKGYEDLSRVELVSGLREGEAVIVEQQDRFREGDRVRAQALAN